MEYKASMKLSILFEDEDLIAVLKPAGLASQSTPDPKRPHVISVLQQQYPHPYFLHHRLDRDTSGVLLLGKTKRVNAGLTEIFREHQIKKTYWALSLNRTPDNPRLLARNFTISDHLAPVRGAGKKLMRMVKVKTGGWQAETHFSLLESFGTFHLIEAKPVTGRTHQIRVHLAGEKLPIAGDFLYGGKSSAVPRILLHAKTLQFVHPLSQKDLILEAPLPKDFQTVLEGLRAGLPLDEDTP